MNTKGIVVGNFSLPCDFEARVTAALFVNHSLQDYEKDKGGFRCAEKYTHQESNLDLRFRKPM